MNQEPRGNTSRLPTTISLSRAFDNVKVGLGDSTFTVSGYYSYDAISQEYAFEKIIIKSKDNIAGFLDRKDYDFLLSLVRSTL